MTAPAPSVSPVPPGFHTVTPHLTVRGAAKAIEFYVKAFGAVELFRNLGPDGKSIMHARVRIGDSLVMLNDEFSEAAEHSPQTLEGSPVTLHVYVPDADAMFRRAVSAGAKVVMPICDAFWGDRYGQLTDPFGHTWSIAARIEDLTPEEMRRRAAAAFGG